MKTEEVMKILEENKITNVGPKQHYNLLSKRKLLKMEYIRTPIEIWKALSKEFNFTVDACASDKNHLLHGS